MKLILKSKKKEAKGTYSFLFEPEGEISWKAGQFINLTLPTGDSKHFTIANSPTEKSGIQITTRIRSKSDFKKKLNNLEVGSKIEAGDPQGNFILQKQTNKSLLKHVFIAGGIGITPFRSIIKNIIDKKSGIPIHLIYSNSDNKFVFKKELDTWVNKNIKIDYVNTKKTGRLDGKKLSYLVPDMASNAFFVVGPPAFVFAIEKILKKMMVKGKNIKTEKFMGY